jgi:hypothetical protein
VGYAAFQEVNLRRGKDGKGEHVVSEGDYGFQGNEVFLSGGEGSVLEKLLSFGLDFVSYVLEGRGPVKGEVDGVAEVGVGVGGWEEGDVLPLQREVTELGVDSGVFGHRGASGATAFLVPGGKECPGGAAFGRVDSEARPVTEGRDFGSLAGKEFRVGGEGKEVIGEGEGAGMVLLVLCGGEAAIVVAMAALVEPA